MAYLEGLQDQQQQLTAMQQLQAQRAVSGGITMSSDQQRQWAADKAKVNRTAGPFENAAFPFHVRITLVPKWQTPGEIWVAQQDVNVSVASFPRQEAAVAFLNALLVPTGNSKAAKHGRMVVVASAVGTEIYEASFDWKANNEHGYGQQRD